MSNDGYMWRNYYAIKSYVDGNLKVGFHKQGMKINNLIMIAKKKTMFRPLGQLDWAWYDAEDLGKAFNNNTVLGYYERMLKDERSYPNKWKRREEEMEKKTEYAERAGNAEWI